MIYEIQEANKFVSKLAADPASFRVQITPDGTLLYEGGKKVPATDFIAVHDGRLWGRVGMTWLPSSPLPEQATPLCAFSLKKLAIFLKEERVECVSPKKELDPATSFLLCTKFPSGIRLLIADPAIGKQHIALTLCRDENGEAFCSALIRQFVKYRLPEQAEALEIILEGDDV